MFRSFPAPLPLGAGTRSPHQPVNCEVLRLGHPFARGRQPGQRPQEPPRPARAARTACLKSADRTAGMPGSTLSAVVARVHLPRLLTAIKRWQEQKRLLLIIVVLLLIGPLVCLLLLRRSPLVLILPMRLLVLRCTWSIGADVAAPSPLRLSVVAGRPLRLTLRPVLLLVSTFALIV